MKQSSAKSTFFGGAATLAMGIIVVKLIGALYKIPLGRILGDVGFGHFNNAYSVFNLLLMVSTAGLPVAMSKAISEANAMGRDGLVSRIFRVCLATFLVLGLVTTAIMFFGAQSLATFQGDSMAAPAIRAMALTAFFLCTVSAYRGYAQGHSDMVPTAVSQVIEALGKLIVGLILAWYFMSAGFGSEIAAAGAIFGVAAGGGLALLYLMVRHHKRNKPVQALPDERSAGSILKNLLVVAVPITLSASVVPITTYIDTIQVQNLLQSALGYSEEMAVSFYGSYQKALTIYNLPSSFMVSLTACIIPAVSAALTVKDHLGASKVSESALRVGAMLALPAGIGLAVLCGPVIQLLYPETNQEVASFCMFILGIASIFVCIMLLCNAVLQAYDKASLPIWFMLIGSVLKLVTNFFLVQQSSFGIKGAPIGTLVCFAIVAILELIAIKRVSTHPPKLRRIFAKPLIASLLMGAAVWAVYGLISPTLGNTLGCGVAILAGVAVYAVLVVVLKVVSKDDLSLMPKGDKIAKLLRIK